MPCKRPYLRWQHLSLSLLQTGAACRVPGGARVDSRLTLEENHLQGLLIQWYGASLYVLAGPYPGAMDGRNQGESKYRNLGTYGCVV
jgi:hypothetical protein